MKSFFLEKAFTLVEILVSLAITSVLSLLIGFFMTRQSRQADFLTYRLNMQTVYDRVEQAVTSRTVLSYSSLFNKDLFNCLNRSSSDPCTATNSESPTPLVLYDFPDSIRKALLIQGEAISISDPDRYQVTGSNYSYKTSALCTSQTPDKSHCQYEVKADFWATCGTTDEYLGDKDSPGSTTSYSLGEAIPGECDQAKTIHIRFQVRHNRPEGSPFLPFQIESMPKDDAFKESAITIPVGSIPPASFRSFEKNTDGTFLCGKNEYLTSIVNGSPVCECLYPFTLQEDGSCKISSGGSCLEGERYRGNDKDGKPICQEVYCENVSIARGCAFGGWIEGIRNNFWSFTQRTNENACAVVTDQCDIQEPNESCSVEVLCDQNIICCYETEPTDSMTAGESDFLAIIDEKKTEHKDYEEGKSGGFEGTLCSSDSNCIKTDYDPRSGITYELLCCESPDGKNRCRRGVYPSIFSKELGYSSGELTCPTRCHDKMDSSNTLDINKLNWAKDYCSMLRTMKGKEADLSAENALEGFIEPYDAKEFQCFSYKNAFGGVRISHEECKGWVYQEDVGCCDNKCISNFSEFEDESGGKPDKVCSFDDNCDDKFNPEQTDLDKDNFGDDCDYCPEDSDQFEGYQGPCGCIGCPFPDEEVDDLEPPIEDLPCEGDDCCEDYLCYDKPFYLYHLDTDKTNLIQLHNMRVYADPNVELSVHEEINLYGFVDQKLIDYCETSKFCDLHAGVSGDHVENLKTLYSDFKFERIDKEGNYPVSDLNELPQEKIIDGADLLHLRSNKLCSSDTGGVEQSCYLTALRVHTLSLTERAIFSSKGSDEGFLISLFPKENSVLRYLKLEKSLPPGVASSVTKCAGPFALQLDSASAPVWIHHGLDSSASDIIDKIFKTGLGSNDHSELFISDGYKDLESDSVKLWACVK